MTSTRGTGGGTGAQIVTEGALIETCGGVTLQADNPMRVAVINAAEVVHFFMALPEKTYMA